MRYWFDTEFIEDGKTIDLISLGIVAEDGRELYRESSWSQREKATEWVKQNVLPHLTTCPLGRAHGAHWSRTLPYDRGYSGFPLCTEATAPTCVIRERGEFAAEIKAFCDLQQYGKPEFWAYYADYDWVVLCQLFGTMMDLPDGWPMYCRDLKQEADRLQDWWRFFNNTPDYKLRLPEQGKGEHHALTDARWNREAWRFLETSNYKTGVYRMRPT